MSDNFDEEFPYIRQLYEKELKSKELIEKQLLEEIKRLKGSNALTEDQFRSAIKSDTNQLMKINDSLRNNLKTFDERMNQRKCFTEFRVKQNPKTCGDDIRPEEVVQRGITSEVSKQTQVKQYSTPKTSGINKSNEKVVKMSNTSNVKEFVEEIQNLKQIYKKELKSHQLKERQMKKEIKQLKETIVKNELIYRRAMNSNANQLKKLKDSLSIKLKSFDKRMSQYNTESEVKQNPKTSININKCEEVLQKSVTFEVNKESKTNLKVINEVKNEVKTKAKKRRIAKKTVKRKLKQNITENNKKFKGVSDNCLISEEFNESKLDIKVMPEIKVKTELKEEIKTEVKSELKEEMKIEVKIETKDILPNNSEEIVLKIGNQSNE